MVLRLFAAGAAAALIMMLLITAYMLHHRGIQARLRRAVAVPIQFDNAPRTQAPAPTQPAILKADP
jgi:hypothetical protein